MKSARNNLTNFPTGKFTFCSFHFLASLVQVNLDDEEKKSRKKYE